MSGGANRDMSPLAEVTEIDEKVEVGRFKILEFGST